MTNSTSNRILIVDDVPANLKMLSDLLEPEGYHILVAPSGEVALKVAARMQPSLILLDIMMPGIDGFETCRRLKEDPATADISIIFVTAEGETESIVKGFQIGGVDYITKPFEGEEVRVRVRNHLTMKRLQDDLKEAYSRLEADNARKTEELENARIIQQGFLPVSTPELSYLEIAAFQKPATEVGGDYYDFFPQADGKLVVAIGDATGHGVGPSLMVSATKMALMTIDEPDITEKLRQINAHLKRINSCRLLNMALTLVELQYDSSSDTVQAKAAGGGMPPLMLLKAGGMVDEIAVKGLPLGVLETAEYEAIEFQVETSDGLVLMSDGLPERINDKGEFPGYTGVRSEIEEVGQTARTAREVLEELVEKSNDWSNNTPQDDDLTVIVLKAR